MNLPYVWWALHRWESFIGATGRRAPHGGAVHVQRERRDVPEVDLPPREGRRRTREDGRHLEGPGGVPVVRDGDARQAPEGGLRPPPEIPGRDPHAEGRRVCAAHPEETLRPRALHGDDPRLRAGEVPRRGVPPRARDQRRHGAPAPEARGAAEDVPGLLRREAPPLRPPVPGLSRGNPYRARPRWPRSVRPLAALLVFLLLLAATPAMAGPEPPSPFATAYNTQRKLVRSGA